VWNPHKINLERGYEVHNISNKHILWGWMRSRGGAILELNSHT